MKVVVQYGLLDVMLKAIHRLESIKTGLLICLLELVSLAIDKDEGTQNGVS